MGVYLKLKRAAGAAKAPQKVTFSSRKSRAKEFFDDYGNTSLRKLIQFYKQKHKGRVWSAEDEAALLRAMLHDLIADFTAKPHWERLEDLKAISEIVNKIATIGEKHAKIEDALKLRIEFSQMQEFANFMIETINRNVKNPAERSRIAGELQGYLDNYETPL